MTTTLRTQVLLYNLNDVPQDICTNTWHCLSESADPLDDAAAFADAVGGFYIAIQDYMSKTINPLFTLNTYDLSDAEPRTIIDSREGTMTLTADPPLPHECAICLSYRGVFLSGAAAARRRGRIFVGPVNSATLDDTVGQARIQSTATAVIANAGSDLQDAGTEGGFQWAVFSPTTAGSPPWGEATLIASTHPVVAGFVDNSYDTIRSRGIEANARSSWS